MGKDSNGKIFVLDTNVILHDSSCIYKFQEHDIVVPIQVVEELDSFKKGFETINFHARDFCRLIDELAGDHIFNGGVELGEGLGKLKIALAVEWGDKVTANLKTQNVDAEIINLAYTLKQANPDRMVIIVSKDVNLRLKAKAIGVVAQDFLHETVVNLESLFEEAQVIDEKKPTIDRLYKDKRIDYGLEKAIANQNFILRSGKQSALARYRDGQISLVAKETLYAYGIKPKNSEQAFALDVLLDSAIELVALEAKAGAGKTILALAAGLQQLKNKSYGKVIFTRQTISMGDREIGYLKGGIDEKIGPFMMAMTDNLEVIGEANKSNEAEIKVYREGGKLMIEPLSYIRGRSINNAYFIIDEAQNLTPHEVKTIVTRAGNGTKVILLGDTHQIDHPFLDQRSNGLSYLIEKFRGQDCFSHIHLLKNERSRLAECAGQLL